jgi:glycosyltransferase involved in cell wall biosynthesis
LVICLDVRPALKGMTGVGTYIYHLSSSLIKKFPDQVLKVFSSSLRDRLESDFKTCENVIIYDRHIPVRLMDAAFNRLRFPPLQFFTGSFDLFHSPSPVLPPLTKCKKIVTVHDLYFLKEPGDTQKLSRSVFSRQVAEHLKKADRIICVSKFTAGEVLGFFDLDPSKIKVIYHGSDHIEVGRLKNPAQAESMRKLFFENNGLPDADSLLLFVGTVEPRKNPALLLDAFENLINQTGMRVNLVYAGGMGWGAEAFTDRLQNSHYRDRIVITGYKQREELNDLYRIADVLVMPSKEEGFGLPLIEAMRFGVPIIAADNSSLPEIGGSAALYFESGSAEGLADALGKLLTDAGLQATLIKKGRQRAEDFSWGKAAEETMDLYREVMNSRCLG